MRVRVRVRARAREKERERERERGRERREKKRGSPNTFSCRLEAERLLKRKWILSCSSSGGTAFS